jgi:predicted ATPase/DNA-binding winged helix-turn-helix (wHTH) protein
VDHHFSGTHRPHKGYCLDSDDERLWRDGAPVPLPPKAFTMLCYLVSHPNRLLTKRELLDAVWPGIYVTEGEVKHYILALRKALDDDCRQPRFIETVHGRGYRFIGDIKIVAGSRSQHNAPRPPAHRQAAPPIRIPSHDRTIGRDVELKRLHQSLVKALAGELQVVFVSGEPGIGKTALITTFVQTLVERGDVWQAGGQCVESYGRDEAYMPVLAALENLCRGPETAQVLACLRRYAPNWLLQLPGLLPPDEHDELQRRIHGSPRARMLRELVNALEMLTAEQGLVLWLEDLHWADVSTLTLIDYLARWRQPARLLLIATMRPLTGSESQDSLTRLLTELHLHRYCDELALEAFSEATVGEYLQTRFSGLPASMARSIHQHTDGNPLFVVSVVAGLLAEGIIVHRVGRWTLSDDPETIDLGIPETLRVLIEQQFERLVGEEQRLLAVASVAGGEFAAPVLAEALGWPVETVEQRCAALVNHGLFLAPAGHEVWPDGTLSTCYAFNHALYRQILYEHMTPSWRRRLHRLIGARLEQGYLGHTEEIAAQLAMHFESSGDNVRAVRYFMEAV